MTSHSRAAPRKPLSTTAPPSGTRWRKAGLFSVTWVGGGRVIERWRDHREMARWRCDRRMVAVSTVMVSSTIVHQEACRHVAVSTALAAVAPVGISLLRVFQWFKKWILLILPRSTNYLNYLNGLSNCVGI